MERLCVIRMALSDVFGGNLTVCLICTQPKPRRALTSRFKTDISCFIPSLSSDKKPRSSPSTWRFALRSLHHETVEKVFSAEGRQSSSGRFIQGTRFSRKDWPQHPWPAGQAAFSLPGALCFTFGFDCFFHTKRAKWDSVRECHTSTRFYQYLYQAQPPNASDLCICLVSICNFLVLFLYMISTLYCALRCEKYIGKIKISTDYAFKWQIHVVRKFLFSPSVKKSTLRNLFYVKSTELTKKRLCFILLFILLSVVCAICRGIVSSGEFLSSVVTSMRSHMDLPRLPNIHKCTKCAVRGKIKPLFLWEM